MHAPLLVGWRGSRIDRTDPLVQAIVRGQVAGVLLFDRDVLTGGERNVIDPQQLRTLIADLQAISPRPLIVAIDQEGGQVQRLRAERGFRETPAAAKLGAGAPTVAAAAFEAQAAQLAELGVTLNFAPVVDLAVNPDNPIIAGKARSFGADPTLVTRLASLALAAHARHGVAAALKHFPGHGSSRADSHLGFVDVSATWQAEELIPYRELITQAPAVLVAHVSLQQFDPQLPASLSKAIVSGLLRHELGYTGAVVTDDLQMKAITDLWPFPASAVLALQAGCDLLVYGNNLTWQPQVADGVEQAVERALADGTLSESALRASWERVAVLGPK